MTLKSSLCDYSHAYILVTGTMAVPNTAAAFADANNFANKVAFKNCSPFTDGISETNITEADNAKYINIEMQMDDLLEYRNNYSKTSGR